MLLVIPDLEERLLTGVTIALLAPADKAADGNWDISHAYRCSPRKDVVYQRDYVGAC